MNLRTCDTILWSIVGVLSKANEMDSIDLDRWGDEKEKWEKNSF